MMNRILLVAAFTLSCQLSAALFASDRHWPLDSSDAPGVSVHGKIAQSPGVSGSSAVFSGESLIKFNESEALAAGEPGFTFTAWVNPYLLNRRQQMIAAKNRYSLNERQWGVMIDKDNRFRLYVWQERWVTADSTTPPRPGHWRQIGVVVRPTAAELWVNGKRAGQVKLAKPISQTRAPLTVGGVDDNGRIWQNFVGAIDEVRLFDRPLSGDEMAATYKPVTATHAIPDFARRMNVAANPSWAQQIEEHARQDRSALVFDGRSPNKLACDTTLRKTPDGSWVMIMLGGGDTEPLPQNHVLLSRSLDEGKTWSAMRPIDLGVKAKNPNAALVPSELMVRGERCTLLVATHDGTFGDWKEWMAHSDDSCRTWSQLEPAPGRLHDRTFIRNHIVTRDGRILLPFQHYLRVGETRRINKGRRFSPPTNPRNGVLMSSDGGKSWAEHGDIRISPDDDYHGWAENNIVELSDGRIAMIIRGDRLGGVLYYAESTDGGRSWPEFARQTAIPNPGSKATLYSLGGDNVALLHNPNSRHRSPLALWVSFDGMKSWPYQRVLVPESRDGQQGRLNYPDGFVSDDRQRLHFAFDDNRRRGVYIGARLPQPPPTRSIWNRSAKLPTTAEAEVLKDVEFHVIKRWQPDVDGYKWLHGVALAWHKGKLYASFGHNKGGENSVTEEGRYTVSSDNGATWSTIRTMDVGTESNDLAVSHGVFLSHGDELWAFLGAFHNTRQKVHTRAYTLNETTGEWRPRGVIVNDGFWPMTEPVKMNDGNWIMPGFIVGRGNPAAVA
ncbi:MAG: exo-alpha-sialidase, partial [Pirellulaceae bacterium]|nr:exo-alpha-sialidase [Pirellulaceae bacterium]